LETGNDLVAEPLQYSSDFGHSFKMKISEISLYFNGLRFHLSILPKSNYLPLCCFTGLAYIDVAGLTQDNIRKSFDGNLWIMTKRQKTNTDVNVPLLDIPKIILKKYKGKLPNGKILPIISNQKLNAYLKEIADVCGIKKNLTFHLARHTFATTTTLSKGVPIETVSKMLGHTNIETTQIYARITNSKIGSDMLGLDKKFVGIEKIYKEVAM
jgi:integrase